MSRAGDRGAARRAAARRLLDAAQAYAATLERRAVEGVQSSELAEPETPELPGVIAALAELEGAALQFAEVARASARRWRGRR